MNDYMVEIGNTELDMLRKKALAFDSIADQLGEVYEYSDEGGERVRLVTLGVIYGIITHVQEEIRQGQWPDGVKG